MMVKGFIFFRDGKIPFVIENYRMELFTDDSLLDDFCKEYNFKENYILHGQCFDIGIRGRKATFLVEMTLCRVHQSVVLATLDTPSMLQLLKILLLSLRTKLILPSIRN